jgi:hypothetical protein
MNHVIHLLRKKIQVVKKYVVDVTILFNDFNLD